MLKALQFKNTIKLTVTYGWKRRGKTTLAVGHVTIERGGGEGESSTTHKERERGK
jgi:hypothetical protein